MRAIRACTRAERLRGPSSGPTRPSYARRCSPGVYGNAKRVGATSNVLQILAPASSAASDRSSMAQKLFFIAALAGLSIGMALAVRSGTRPVEEPARQVRAAPAA